MPKRDDFDALTNRLTARTSLPGELSVGEIQAMPQFKGLSQKAIEILLLKHVAAFADREIASTMNMTVDGVRSSLKRSRSRMLTKNANNVVLRR